MVCCTFGCHLWCVASIAIWRGWEFFKFSHSFLLHFCWTLLSSIYLSSVALHYKWQKESRQHLCCQNLGSLCINAKKKYRDRVMEEKERVTLLLCQTKGEHSRLVPQELCPIPSWWVVVPSLSHVWLFATPQAATLQASLFFTLSLGLLKLMCIELVMPSNHLTFCCPLLLPSIFPSIRVFSNELALPGE